MVCLWHFGLLYAVIYIYYIYYCLQYNRCCVSFMCTDLHNLARMTYGLVQEFSLGAMLKVDCKFAEEKTALANKFTALFIAMLAQYSVASRQGTKLTLSNEIGVRFALCFHSTGHIAFSM